MYTFTFLCAFGLLPALLEAVSSAEQTEIVNKHNDLRRNVSPTASDMLKMSWSSEAAANAQTWANGCSMNHSPSSSRVISSSGCGENLRMHSNQQSWSEAIQSWYDEVDDWTYGQGATPAGSMIGHFTQVAWYRSNQVGCAMAHCPDATYPYFYVCHYCPPGNYQYTHPYKEGAACGDCPNDCDNKLCTNPCTHTDLYNNCAQLVENNGCSGTVGSWCPATCLCDTEII